MTRQRHDPATSSRHGASLSADFFRHAIIEGPGVCRLAQGAAHRQAFRVAAGGQVREAEAVYRPSGNALALLTEVPLPCSMRQNVVAPAHASPPAFNASRKAVRPPLPPPLPLFSHPRRFALASARSLRPVLAGLRLHLGSLLLHLYSSAPTLRGLAGAPSHHPANTSVLSLFRSLARRFGLRVAAHPTGPWLAFAHSTTVPAPWRAMDSTPLAASHHWPESRDGSGGCRTGPFFGSWCLWAIISTPHPHSFASSATARMKKAPRACAVQGGHQRGGNRGQ